MFRFDNSYSRLPSSLFLRLDPVPVSTPRIILFNEKLAAGLGLKGSALQDKEGTAILAGNAVPEGAAPLAQAYAGHQFGHFNMLGDGRAILLGEHCTPHGTRVDIQLKGSGRTPFSRGGDGRATLGPMVREYIISEAMHALGIPTTRSLAVVATGETVLRERPLPGAVLTRVAASHLRVGTFEYAAYYTDRDTLRALADYAITRHYPMLAENDRPYLALLEAVIDRQAALIARWMLVGFVHGVMNTDNMTISGETIDYGPCAFMDQYDPDTVFSSIDRQGRYAYGNQPGIAHWNLTRFAEALLPLLDADQTRAIAMAEEALAAFGERFADDWQEGMRAKLGLGGHDEGDAVLIRDLLAWMQAYKVDYTTLFRTLSEEHTRGPYDDAEWSVWHARWSARLTQDARPLAEVKRAMRLCNPAVIPRNDRVEEALTAAVEQEDTGPLERLLAVLKQPFADCTDRFYTAPPEPGLARYQTFCGT
jgi:uncharacterized protein YdiU (UPF0061 family)